MDNANNNDSLMVHLESLLHSRGIPFDKVQRRIRYDKYHLRILKLMYLTAAFPISLIWDVKPL
jgi:hypothetical protein